MRFAPMEKTPEQEEGKTSLFPLFPTNSSSNTISHNHNHQQPHQWLSNTSFTANLSAVNTAVTSIYDALTDVISEKPEHDTDNDAEDLDVNRNGNDPVRKPSYEMLDDSPKSETEKKRRRRNRDDQDDVDGKDGSPKSEAKMKRKRRRNRDDVGDLRKKSWPSSGSSSSKAAKEYYFDSRGDRDNLAFGCIYRMDLSRYRLINSVKISDVELQALCRRHQMGSNLDKDGDIDKLDSKLKSSGRYWSAKYSAVERHKNLKRLRIARPKKSATTIPSDADDFIPLSTSIESSGEGISGQSVLPTSTVEESWEEEVSRQTKEFNKMTRERPHDEKGWLAFAEFQETVASMQPQKGARLQTLEKKISILEKASELNPENEEILLCLLKSYQTRDSTDALFGRWEKVLMQHSGSCRLWKEFLHVVQGEFSRFKVPEMRKMFTHAIQALSSACIKQYRQVTTETVCKEQDPSIVLLELGLIDVFVSLCRFEWQAGYQELATACFQAQIEYSLFTPSLYLTETCKQRLFEYFWNSDGARIGEEAALGWATWLTKEEESRQKGIEEEISHDNDEGGWTGWSNPLSKQEEISHDNDDNDVEEIEDELMTENIENKDDTEALLKKLGIDIDAKADGEVKDTSTWIRWSEEELSRDCEQWMPFHAKSTAVESHPDASPERETDEQLSRVILFEEVSEFLFSLSSVEARLSLTLQFIDFFGGKISQRICTNNSIWSEKLVSLDVLPDSILECLGTIHDVLSKSHSSCEDLNLEKLLRSSSDISKKTSMMKFLRNAVLLCLTVFPRNYILEEAVLVAEDLSITKMNTSRLTVTPCRPLAKCLLKCDRQDLLLCGIYAQREAAFGNIEYARKVFDMALSSVEGLPLDLRSNAPLLYFWYAEVEVANSSGNSSESSLRAMHILSCLGSGISYSTYKCQPSSIQLLKAHQGFRERIRTVRSTWARGAIQDSSVALICSAALFEELTTGGAAGLEVLDQTFSMVLPERKRQSYQLEYLFNYHVNMLKKHCKQTKLSKVWEVILNGLQIYPLSPGIFSSLIEISHLYSVPNKLRWMLDDLCHKKPSVIVWIFALSYELSRQGSQHKVHALFEKAFENEELLNSVILWRCYIAFEADVVQNLSSAKRIFFRAIHACPWSKKLWLDGFQKLNTILTAKELSDLQEVMRDKELNLRTDIYEILLQDESKSFQ